MPHYFEQLTQAFDMWAVRSGDARGVPLALLLDHRELEVLPGVERPEAIRVNDRMVDEDVSKHQLVVFLQGHAVLMQMSDDWLIGKL